jgi:menaquinone-specific isochorismate synthase
VYIEGSAAERPEAGPAPVMPAGRLLETGPDEWVSTMTHALDAIDRQEVDKVVLSRQVRATFDAPIATHLVLAALAAAEPGSHTFLVDDLAGSSPELLCSLRNGVARSVSLAGSAGLEDTMGVNPLDSRKMALEHNLAADSVDEALAPFCSDLNRSPSTVATYGEIRHLSTTFEGVARPGTSITDLLGALHPTAAVAGTPTKAALELIRELEDHDRGRYAGPVGWMDRDGDGEFAIALRCGEIRWDTATLYAGAGVVRGSDPMLEFEETSIKLRPMLGALGLR